MKTYYKVLLVKSDGLMVSISDVHNNPFKITYEPNKWITPSVGKLFVFDSLLTAMETVRELTDKDTTYKLFECECKNPIKPEFDRIVDLDRAIGEDIECFWEKEDKTDIPIWRVWYIPTDTYLCDSIKLTNEIKAD
jgi:hypothetical protein